MSAPRMIAVGFDGSPESITAVEWALHLGAATHAEITVTHAAGLLEHLASEFDRDEKPAEVLELAAVSGFDVARLHWRVDDGDACSVLLRTTEPPVNADLLVVGSRGRGRHPGLLLGSTSLELAEHTTTPLVIVPSSHGEGSD